MSLLSFIFLLAAALVVSVGIAHSVLGERSTSLLSVAGPLRDKAAQAGEFKRWAS
jgi:hypothetical protein